MNESDREHFDQRLDFLLQELVLINKKLEGLPKCCCEPLQEAIRRNREAGSIYHGYYGTPDATHTWMCPVHGRQYG